MDFKVYKIKNIYITGNEQVRDIEMITSMFTSWALSRIYPFGICFITSIFRILALRCKKKFLYRVNKILQLI